MMDEVKTLPQKMNESKCSLIQSGINYEVKSNEKEIEMKVPTTSDTMASSHNLYYNNEYKTMEINLQNKILKKKAKIRKLKEQIENLIEENTQLKNNNVNSNQNEQIEALKNQIIKYEQSLNDTSSHYESQIETLQNKLNDYIAYINLINKFINNISNDLNSSAYSRSPPTGIPWAILVTLMPAGFISLAMYIAVASPSILGFVAIISSFTSPA